MYNTDLFVELTPIFQDIFDDDDIIPRPDMAAKDVDSWDSLNHIRLIIAIEGHFNIRFTTAEVNQFQNVGDLVATIQDKLKS
ncbi:MAG: acyl carrier protein [Pseudomonadota bacterium]